MKRHLVLVIVVLAIDDAVVEVGRLSKVGPNVFCRPNVRE